MSNTWISRVYLPLRDEWPNQIVADLMIRLSSAGLIFPKQTDGYKCFWFSKSSADCYEIKNLPDALTLTAQNRGGSFDLVNLETDMYASVNVCLNGDQSYPPTSAEFSFGYLGLSIQYAYLHNESDELLKRRYQLLFRWSKVLSETSQAVYGWGDTEYGVVDISNAVRAVDLIRWNIPRLSWWSFYSKDYLKNLAGHRLSTSAAFLTQEDAYGLTIISFPPGEPVYSSVTESQNWYM